MTARQESRFYRETFEFRKSRWGPLCNTCGHHQDWHLGDKCLKCEEKDAYHTFKPTPIGG